MEQTDVILIGAGPIGLEMAANLKAQQVDYMHLEAQHVGYTISWFPKGVRFFSSPERIAICGVPLVTADQSKASREEYLAYLRGIVELFDLPIRTYERVTDIHRDEAGDGFIVTSSKQAYRAKHVITTIGDMHRPRMLGVEGEELPHVEHYFDEPHKYFRQKLLIVGGKNSAVEAAIRCHNAGAEVTISYRNEEFNGQSVKYWLKPEIDWLIKTSAIRFIPKSQVTHIAPTHTTLQTSQGEQTVEADFVLLLVGYEMDTSLLEAAGVELHGANRAPRLDSETMQANVPGLFVAGTAAAGTQQRFRLFIENCHSHVVRIMRAITGEDPRHVSELAWTRLHEQPLEDDEKAER